MPERKVVKVIQGIATSDGAGVRLRRSLGTPSLPMLDPFLMLDEFRSDDPNDYVAGFPDHPHRGFETVTYMLAGVAEHQDSVGNKGKLVAGGAQWMTAGRGIIHSEMPKQENGLLWGFQLWVNLPAAKKMVAPRYQDIEPSQIPEVKVERATVRVIVGEAAGVKGPVNGIATDPLMLDVRLDDGATFRQAVPEGHNAFAYVYDGEVEFGADNKRVKRGELAVLADGDAITARAHGAGGKLLLLAGRPIGEPVARYGPFVMNTEREIRQAILDFQTGRLA